jgi:hypothetical protein
MGMQTDVKAASRSTSGLFIGGRNRLKGLYFEVPADNGCFIDFYDALTETGDPVLSFDLGDGDSQTLRFPGEGILFETGMYLFISGGNAPNITIFYG